MYHLIQTDNKHDIAGERERERGRERERDMTTATTNPHTLLDFLLLRHQSLYRSKV